MKLGSLFSGGGLGDFGFMASGIEIAWQCEIDPYCQKILALRYPESKKYTDIKTLKGAELERVDIITGGFPCQPFSKAAGKPKGFGDHRFLWPEMFRIIKECRPRWIVGENVLGIVNLALDTICLELEGQGYEVWPIIFPSHALGAWHKRDRVWIVANRRYYGWSAEQEQQQKEWTKEPNSSSQRIMADTKSQNDRIVLLRKEKRQIQKFRNSFESFRKYWETEPLLDRVGYGRSDRVHRLKMLGNGQVPACTYVIGKMIMDIENGQT